MQTSVQAIAPTLSVTDGTITTTSNEVAQHFGKQHKHVLDKIAALLATLPTDFAEPNFRLSEFADSTGRTLPAYRLTRDGFTLLAMGFTGSKALTFKLAYIDAFNKLEASLIPRSTPLNAAQKQHLHELVDLIAATGKQSHAESWARLHRKFKVNSYHQLTEGQFDAACTYLRSKMDDQGIATLVQKHFPKAIPLPAPSFDPTTALTRGQSELTINLPANLDALINRRAGEMAGQAYSLSREHLLRRLAHLGVVGNRLDEDLATDLIRSCTLGAALTHEYISRLKTVQAAFQFAIATAQEGLTATNDSLGTAQWSTRIAT